jgi:DMSO/TMAO reductase YedYZ molybdopterin-dependent catalytic subunit
MNSTRRYRGLHELYGEDPELADWQLFGRGAEPLTRRGLLRSAGVAALGAVVGGSIPFGRYMPAGLGPVALASSTVPFEIPGMDPGLIILNDRPLNAETPAHLLDDAVTPASRLFVRNNGIPPEAVDEATWRLRIEGESAARPREFSLAELRANFTQHSYELQLECGGNGRSDFYPAAKGNQWTTGAVGCATWTGCGCATC